MAEQSDQRRHCLLNPRVTLVEGNSAQVLLTVLLFSAASTPPQLVTTGFYRVDAVDIGDGGWRIGRVFSGFDVPAAILK
jgi:hypothetical protein